MKKLIVLLVLGLLILGNGVAEDLTEDMLIGTWRVYWTEVHKAEHYFPRVGGGDIIEFHENHIMIRKENTQDIPGMKYVFRLLASSRKIWVYDYYTKPPKFIYQWQYECLTPDILVATLWCPGCDPPADIDDITILVKQK